MDNEIVKVIKIETEGGEKTIQGLKDEIVSLRDALLNTEKGSEEYKSILEQLIEDQRKLTDVMNAGKKEATAMEGSYNALVNEMAALKKVWRETTDEASRAEIGAKINSINDQLKEMDSSIGNNQRRVGTYTQAFQSAMGNASGAVRGLTSGIGGADKAMKALAKNPIMIILTAIGMLITGVVKGFKSSEENMNKLKQAFAAFKPIGDAVTKVFQAIASVVGTVVKGLADGVSWLIGKLIPAYDEAARKREKIANDEIRLTKMQRDNIMQNAELERDASALRAEAADKSKYTAEQRLEFLKQAGEKEAEIAKNEVESLKLEYEIIKAKNALSESSAEDKQKEAEAYAAMIKAQTAYNNALKKNNQEISRTRKEMENERRAQVNAMLNLEKDLVRQEYDLATEGSEDQLRLARTLRKKELDIQIQGLKEKIKNRKELNKAILLAQQQYERDLENIELNAARKRMTNDQKEREIYLLGLRKNSVAYARQALEDAENELNAMQYAASHLQEKDSKGNLLWKLWGDDDVQSFKKRVQETINAVDELDDNLTQTMERDTKIFNNIVLSGLEPASLQATVLYKQAVSYYNSMEKLNSESDDEFKARRLAASQAVKEALVNMRELNRESLSLGKELSNVQARFDELDNRSMFRLALSTMDLYGGEMKRFWTEYFNLIDGFKNRTNDALSYINVDRIKNNIEQNVKAIRDAFGDKMAEDQKKGWLDILGIENLDELTAEKISKVYEQFRDLDIREITENQLLDLKSLVEGGIIPESVLTDYLETLKGVFDTEKGYLQQSAQNWSDLGSHIGDIMSSIGDIYEIDLENRKKNLEKNGKYDEEAQKQLEKEYKKVQAMKIAQATINTISGALAAFMGYQELGQPWGGILGAAAAAAVMASGIAQIQQIRNTNPYSDNSSSLSASVAAATPSLNEYTPTYTENLTGQNETTELANALSKQKLYVSVTDIEDTQKLVSTRTAESTF